MNPKTENTAKTVKKSTAAKKTTAKNTVKKVNTPTADAAQLEIKEALESKLKRYYGISPTEATEDQLYRAVVLSVKDVLMRKRADQHNAIKKNK